MCEIAVGALNPSKSFLKGLTLSTKKEERSSPKAAKNPPKKAVFRIPNLSVRIPAKADNKKVAPTVMEPTSEAFVAASYTVKN